MPELMCDTSAVVALHQVGLLGILRGLASTVVIPDAVQRELAAGRSAGHSVPDLPALDWITARTPSARPNLPDASKLDAGESEVLWLALECPGRVVVLDETAARHVAWRLGISFTGTLGLLVDAKRKGLITAVAPVLNQLVARDFHMAPHLRATILTAAGEFP